MPSFAPVKSDSPVTEAEILIHYIRKYYWNISLERIEHAFILHVQEELTDYGAPSICGSFSCAYFSKVLKAYFHWMKAHGEVRHSHDAERMVTIVPASRQLQNSQDTDWSDFLKQEHTSVLTIPVACYDWLVKNKNVLQSSYEDFIDAALVAERAKAAIKYVSKRMAEREAGKILQTDPQVVIHAKKLFVLHYLNSQKHGQNHNSG